MDKKRGRIINPDWSFAGYDHIIIGRGLRTSTLRGKKLKMRPFQLTTCSTIKIKFNKTEVSDTA